MKTIPFTLGLLAGALTLASAQPPAGTVSGVTGVKQDAIEKIKPVEPPTVPPPNTSTAQPVQKVDGIHTIDGVKAKGQAAPPPTAPPPPPPPPPPPAAHVAHVATATQAAAIRAVHGVGGLNAVKLQNLETALKIKQASGGTPIGNGAEGGKGKAAAAALLAAPLDKVPPKTGPKEDGRAGFQEFEKLQNRGS